MRLIYNLDSGAITGAPFGLGSIGSSAQDWQQITAKIYESKRVEIEFRRESTLNGETEDLGADPGLDFLIKLASGAARYDMPSLIPSVTFTREGSAGAYYYAGVVNFAQPIFEKYLGVDYREQYESFSVECIADVADALNGKYFVISTANSSGTHAIQIHTTGLIGDLPDPGTDTVTVVSVSTGDSAATIAAAIEAAGAPGDFSPQAVGDTVTYTETTYVAHGHHTAGNSGFTVTLLQTGMAMQNVTDVASYEFAGELVFEYDGERQSSPTISILVKNTLYRPNLAAPVSVLPGGRLSTLQALGVLGVAKAASTTRTSTTTLTADPELVLAIPAGTWRVVACLVFDNESASPGDKVQFTFSGTQTLSAGVISVCAAGASVSETQYPSGANAGIFAPTTTSTAEENAIRLEAVVVVTLAGNFSVTWAQNTSHADDTILKAGSHVTAIRIA